ncbi:MAG: SDR family NAD(P)-dependent oxidoreductase [Alkalispirochaetaceae bacterium]
MEQYIITGTSRGIGHALAELLIERGAAVVGISRSENGDLLRKAKESAGSFTHLSGDLGEISSLPRLMKRAMEALGSAEATSITLVNNAGILEPVGFLKELEPRELDRHWRINLIAPAALTGLFLKATTSFAGLRRVLSLTSGAASNPYPGWAGYCTSKAGIEMMTRVAAEEEGERARIIAVAPGTVETKMQQTMRGMDESRFPRKERFLKLKEEGRLSAPRAGAARLLRALEDPAIKTGEVVDVRKLYPER